ncbi:MAG: aminoglycoside phosphotransferase family protein [Bacteroidaceae bacterium]|nr:aminoglycoside phosphotransferase family protein [Bacteroidaceae bacterium]
MTNLEIAKQFKVKDIAKVKPLRSGLINDTYLVWTKGADAPQYVLQRINNFVFKDVNRLQNNISKVTKHLRKKLVELGETDIDRKVVTLVPTQSGKSYFTNGEKYWRMMVFIPHAEQPEMSLELYRKGGAAIGRFESMLADFPTKLRPTIPHFHDIDFRMREMKKAHTNAIKSHRDLKGIGDLREALVMYYDYFKPQFDRFKEMPQRICHFDTKLSNMLFDENGEVLCLIDLDTVMSGYVTSDYGDFLRTAANLTNENDRAYNHVGFNIDVFKAFHDGYIQATKNMLTPVEKELLPYSILLFPLMQSVRFLTDYMNGNVYYHINYEQQNLIRAKNQFTLIGSIIKNWEQICSFTETTIDHETNQY